MTTEERLRRNPPEIACNHPGCEAKRKLSRTLDVPPGWSVRVLPGGVVTIRCPEHAPREER